MTMKKPDTFTRAAAMRGPRTLNDEGRSFEVIAASEAPVKLYDWESGRELDEILIASGFSLPRGRKQVPLQDSHNASTVAATLGSARSFAANGDEVHALVEFATDAESERAFNLYKAGHLTDFSVRYSRDKVVMLDEGKKKTIGGREYSGPAMLVTKWTIKELSPTPIGADERTVARSAESDAEQNAEPHQEVEPMHVDKTTQEPVPASRADEGVKPTPAVDLDAVREEAIRAEQKRVSDIRAACRAASVIELEDELIDSRTTVADAQARIIQELGKKQKPVTVEVRMGETDGEKFSRAAADALIIRSLGKHAIKNPAAGSDQMNWVSFRALARECLRRSGNTRPMNDEEAVRAALGMRSSGSIPSMNTADFTYILADAATKALMAGYTYAEPTYNKWCKIGSLPDFKTARRVRLSDAPELLEVKEGSEVTHGTMSDTGESVALVTYARKLVLTRQALANDDLSAFDMIFAAFGMRALDLVNSLPYAVLLANAALADGGTLFNTTALTTSGGHANQAGSGAAISQTTLAAGYSAMMKQTNPNGTKGMIRPAFLLSGTAYAVDAFTATGAVFSSSSEPGNKPNFFANVIPIADSNITGNKWFLAAGPSIPTVEVAFLNGVQNPTLTQEDTSPILGIDFTAFIDVTAKALDYRGLYYNPGA